MDNHHVTVMTTQMSCGVAQLSGITSEPEKVLYALAVYLYHPARGTPVAFVQWSDTKESNGKKLADFIFGQFPFSKYVKTDWVENPKTSNDIAIWTWFIPHIELKDWYIKERMKKASKL